MIFLKPVFHEKIWGGTRLSEIFSYDIPSSNTGECWAISAHENGDCIIAKGAYEGKTLSWLYENRRNLFGNISYEKFPLLVKLIDAKNKLSVQVHPDDKYAKEVEGVPFGKTECWYIVDCANDAEIIIGHHAKSRDEMKHMVENNQWDKMLRRKTIKPGDFFYISAGTVHAICENTLILEVQQSSDTTYRFYDYGRLQDGKPRDLHIKKSIDVSIVPHEDYVLTKNISTDENIKIDTLVEEQNFTVRKITSSGKAAITIKKPFLLCNVLDGRGVINNESVGKGDNFILTSDENEIEIDGDIELIISSL